MATCFENLVKHFELVIWQLEQMKFQDKVEEENKEKLYELYIEHGRRPVHRSFERMTEETESKPSYRCREASHIR